MYFVCSTVRSYKQGKHGVKKLSGLKITSYFLPMKTN